MLVWFLQAGVFSESSFMCSSARSAYPDGAPTMGLLSEGCWGHGTEPGTRQAYGHDSVTTQQLY